jgi:multidrug efflux system membrane fusion protein
MSWKIAPRARCLVTLAVASLVTAPLLIGCNEEPVKAAAAPVPSVLVMVPVEREVTDYVDFTGRAGAVQSVEIRPRVSGYLTKMPFVEGMTVNAGDVLFEIDPRPYEAALHKSEGEVLVAEARRKLAVADLARAVAVNKQVPTAISEQDIQKYQATKEEWEGSKRVAEANVEAAQIDLKFTKVTSPITGTISRYYHTLGNLVNKDQTLLTTVVSEDPIYVYFDVDERTMMKAVRERLSARDDPLAKRVFQVLISLPDEDTFSHRGVVDFANNSVDSSTGTIVARGVFDNPAYPSGARLLRPGMFLRVRILTGAPYKALVVPERAFAIDQGEKYLLVVDSNDTVQYRRVVVGPIQEDGTRVVADGLKPGERVIVSGLQLVRPGMKVTTETAPAKTGSANAAKSAAPAAAPATGRRP